MNGFGTSPLELLASEAMIRGLCKLEQFTYSAAWIAGTATALASLGTTDVQIQINGDSDFVVQEMNVTVFTNTTTINASPNMLLTIVRSGSGFETSNQPQHIQNIAGNFWNNASPGRMPCPAKYDASNNITLRLQNLVAVAAGRVDIALVGFKVYYINGGTPMNVFNPSAAMAQNQGGRW